MNFGKKSIIVTKIKFNIIFNILILYMSPLFMILMHITFIMLFIVIYIDVKYNKNHKLASNTLFVLIILTVLKCFIFVDSYINNISTCDTAKNLMC